MSTNIIHSISVERDRSDLSVFSETTKYSCSNVWNYDNKSRPRHDNILKFSDSETGNFAMYISSLGLTREFSSGCCKGFGVTSRMPEEKIFRRNVNRANKAGMRVPAIADPKECSDSYDNEGIFPSLLGSRIECALRARKRESSGRTISSITVPSFFESSYDLGPWASEQRLSKFTLKARNNVSKRVEKLRFFLKDGVAYQFARHSNRRGWYFDGRDYTILGLEKVTRWS